MVKWIWVSLPHATFLLGIDEKGIIRDGAPIARWAIGKDEVTVWKYYRAKGADFAKIEEHY